MYTLFYAFSHSCFISDIGVFFGAFLVPIILIMIFNVCIFISSSYVVIKLKIKQQKRNKARTNMKKTNTCKLLALLAGFMFLLGLSWLILMFTVVGADTNIYASFAIQWLFVFFNSLQGFFLFVFFVALNPDARKLWLVCFQSCLKIKTKSALMNSKYRNSSATGNTTSTKLAEYSHSDNMKGNLQNHPQSETGMTSVSLETIIDNTSPVKTHDVETIEITFTAVDSGFDK